MLGKLRDLLKPKTPSGSDPSSPSSDSPDAMFLRAQELQQGGKLAEAITLYSALIERQPDRAEAFYKRANALNSLGQFEAAVADYDRATQLNPSYTYAWCNRGSALEKLKRPDEALTSYDRALELDPNDALTHYNRGSVLKDLTRYEQALREYETAVTLNPNFAEGFFNRGSVLQELRRYPEAIESFDRAIALQPMMARAFLARGDCQLVARRLPQALTDYNRAIALQPSLAKAYLGRANVLTQADRWQEAIADYTRAVDLEPDAEIFQQMGEAFSRLKQLDRSIESMDKAFSLKPDLKYLQGARRWARMQVALWEGLDHDLAELERGVREARAVCHPMPLASLSDSCALLRSAAEIFVKDTILDSSELRESLKQVPDIGTVRRIRPASDRIRIGYFSGDFRTHPVGLLTAGLFEQHDRSRFETFGFASGPESSDPIAARLAAGFDRFIDVRQQSDIEVVRMARELELDLAVDLSGFSAYCRPIIFALRAAPVQINFLGSPITMGAPFMDYLIADRTVVPQEQRSHFAEKIVWLPDSFLPFDSKYAIADRAFVREELGLPADGFVFCCFNNTYKILPAAFDRWMRILGSIEGSVLWLQAAESMAVDNLRKEATRRGIDGRRLIFASRMASLPDHMARLRCADLFLDTAPYNAHATSLDALWAGVPVLTLPGESFASRVAASLLQTLHLPELIAGSGSQYEEIAVALARDPARLNALKARLAEKSGAPFDTVRYARNLENAYHAIVERHRDGKTPDHIELALNPLI